MKTTLVALFLFALVCGALLFAQPAECREHNKAKRAAEYHVTTSSSADTTSSSSSGSTSTSTYDDYGLPTNSSIGTETSPISAGSNGWDTRTTTSFDPNDHRAVGNSTFYEAIAYTSSPAPARMSVSLAAAAGLFATIAAFVF